MIARLAQKCNWQEFGLGKKELHLKYTIATKAFIYDLNALSASFVHFVLCTSLAFLTYCY